MILRSNNFTVDPSIVDECIQESRPVNDRNTMFNNLVDTRLTAYNINYMERLNNQLDNLVSELSSDNSSPSRIGKTIKKLNIALDNMYSSEIALLKLI